MVLHVEAMKAQHILNHPFSLAQGFIQLLILVDSLIRQILILTYLCKRYVVFGCFESLPETCLIWSYSAYWCLLANWHWPLPKQQLRVQLSGFRLPPETIAQSDIFGAGCVDIAGGSGSSHSSYSCKPGLNRADVSQMPVSSDYSAQDWLLRNSRSAFCILPLRRLSQTSGFVGETDRCTCHEPKSSAGRGTCTGSTTPRNDAGNISCNISCNIS